MRTTLRRFGVGIAVTALALTTAAGTATAAPTRVDRAAIQTALDKITKDGALGAQVRITEGRKDFQARSGVAELGRSKPVPLDGRFRIGSITKIFTATVVLQLVGEGRISLDAPVSRHLPGLLPDGDRITVRNLLQHTSGLYNFTNSAIPADGVEFEKIRFRHYEPRDLVAIATARPLDFEPGTRFSYSNTNYTVAGMLIEKVTGTSFERAVEQRILRPIGLRDTTLPGDRSSIQGPHAHGYYTVATKPVDVTRLNPSMAWSAGAAISTTADLDRFITALLKGKLLAPAQLTEMTTTLPITQGYGLGLAETPLPCGVSVWGHSGGIHGYLSLVASTRDTSKRLELSLTTAPTPGGFAGYEDLLRATFC